MTDEQSLINLKVLSPSAEVQGHVNLPDLPASTTVQQLRERIHEALPSHPAKERMRLIYRGKVLADESSRLVDIFGLENVRDSKDQSLHLVLRELPSADNMPRGARAGPSSNSATIDGDPSTRSAPPHPRGPFIPPHLHQRLVPPMAPNGRPVDTNERTHPAPPSLFQSLQPPSSRSNTPGPTDGSQPAQGAPRLFGATGPSPFGSSTIRQHGVGPEGQRWTVTFNQDNIVIPGRPSQQPILPRPFPHPPGFPMPPSNNSSPHMLARVRLQLQDARHQMENMRVMLRQNSEAPTSDSASSNGVPWWRASILRGHLQNAVLSLDNVERDLFAIRSDPSIPQSQDLNTLRQLATDLRVQAIELTTMLAERGQDTGNQTNQQGAMSATPARPSVSSPLMPSQPTQSGSESRTSSIPTELFLLSSPEGPVGVLFDRNGTYATAPMVPAMPFQNFTQQFASNRQLIANLGQQMGQNVNILRDRTSRQPLSNQQSSTNSPPATDQARNQAQDQGQNQGQQLQGQDRNANANANAAPAPAPEQDRFAAIAGHLWLIFKLVCFVYVFSGYGGWYRPLMFGLFGIIVYIAQTGIFEAQINMVRRHFEALLPLADHHAAPARAANADGNAQQAAAPDHRRADPTPEAAARELLRRHQDRRFGWARDAFRGAERAVVIFVASLLPGVGERLVQAQEERRRAERALEEQRRQQQQQQEQEQEQQDRNVQREGQYGGESEETERQRERERAPQPGVVDAAAAAAAAAAAPAGGS